MASTPRDLFPGTAGTAYLNTAVMALGAAPVRAAYDKALADWMEGRFDWAQGEQAGDDARAMLARLIGAQAHEVALVPSVSTAAGTVAAQLGPARPGENILVGEQEFTSNYLPWTLLARQGYEIRRVPFDNGAPAIDAFAARADQRTRLLAVSAVQSASGVAADLAAMSELARRSQAWVFADACQAVGAVPVDVKQTGVDFLATSGHKFLCGTRGMGYLYARQELLPALRPVLPGWKSAAEPAKSFFGPDVALSPTASRIDASLDWFAALGDREALGIFERFGADQLFEANRRLVRHLRLRLAERGFAVEDPGAPVRSTIVSVAVGDTEGILRKLADAKVKAAVRTGRIRVSPHFYNTPEEIDRLVSLLGAPG